jgi:hypothetical protein
MDFFERNLGVTAILLLLGGSGTALALASRAWRKTAPSAIAAGCFAILFALACLAVGWAQRDALLRAAVSVKTLPGLSRADRGAIVARNLADARSALVLSLVLGSVPLGAGVVALAQGVRERARARAGSRPPFV